jgi:hypothetical protein
MNTSARKPMTVVGGAGGDGGKRLFHGAAHGFLRFVTPAVGAVAVQQEKSRNPAIRLSAIWG